MELFSSIDWDKIFVPDMSLLEIFIRGSFVYIALFILLRVVLKRQAGGVSLSDLLVIVLIADAAQNAMAADYKSIPDGILLVATLIFWNVTFEWLGYHFTFFERWVHPSPLPLVRKGRIIRANMRHELITKEELMSQLREQGVEDIWQVKTACLEGDGKLSVIQYDKRRTKRGPRKTI